MNIRKMRDDEARTFLELHHAAVHGLAMADYPPDVIDDWAPLPVREGSVDKFRRNLRHPDEEIRLFAEIDGIVVGLGVLGFKRRELLACYVAPGVARRGVGSALVREMERHAQNRGISCLRLDASITAVPFYQSLGYGGCRRGEHVLWSGRRMACVRMEKRLVPPCSGDGGG